MNINDILCSQKIMKIRLLLRNIFRKVIKQYIIHCPQIRTESSLKPSSEIRKYENYSYIFYHKIGQIRLFKPYQYKKIILQN